MSLPESGEAPGEGGGAQEEVFGVRVPALVLLKKYRYTMGICSRAHTESQKPILWLLLTVMRPVAWESSSLLTPPFVFLGEGENA